MMMPSLRFREYIEAANLAHQHAQSERNSHAKQILQEIERSYRRLIEMEKWEQQQYNRPFARFGLFDGR
jgi:endonuclease YncB( thermonuclease family)